VAITTSLVLIGQPIFRLLFFLLPAILSFFHTVGKLTILIIVYALRFIDRLVSQVRQTSQSIFQKAKLLNRNIIKLTKTATQKIKFLLFRIAFPKLPKFSLRFLLTKKSFFLLVAGCCLLVAVYLFYFLILYDLPSPNQLITRQPILTTKIYDRHGQLLYKIYRRQNRSLVKLEDIPSYMKEATVAIEDKNFYRHQGLSFTGIARSLYRNFIRGTRTGGSTITQQLVKNALLTPEKTMQRKVKEIILSLLVETKFSKDEILQMYLNEVPYGSVAYGIEEAAQAYFNKHVNELDLAEAALLAGLPAAPTNYSPFGAHPELAKIRQKQTLEAMVEEGYITQNHMSIANSQNLVFAPQRNEIRAPHFVMYVKDLLVKKYGQTVVENGGLEVITSLDLGIQEMAQRVVTEEIEKLKNLEIDNGAALVTNPKTGEISAMVGSKDYFGAQTKKDGSTPFQGNFNVTLAARQPGSSIKPINYAVALQNGFTPASIISDTPVTYKIPGQEPYSPKNYDNRFHGNVSLRTALASSYNVPAVKVLAAMGVERMIDQAEKMGITTWEDRSRFGLSLTLGGGEVKMTDMATVYGVLANSGIKTDLNPILEVKDYQGRILETNKNHEIAQVLSPETAYILADILADNRARTPAFGPNSLLNIPNHKVAVKTGTTNNLRDNWAIGFTPSFLVTAWVGNNDNTPMSYVASGITGATPIWHQIMNNLLKNQVNEEFVQPANLKEITICGLTNTLTCSACPNPKAEFFLPGNEPQYACNEEMIRKILEPKEEITPTPQIGP